MMVCPCLMVEEVSMLRGVMKLKMKGTRAKERGRTRWLDNIDSHLKVKNIISEMFREYRRLEDPRPIDTSSEDL